MIEKLLGEAVDAAIFGGVVTAVNHKMSPTPAAPMWTGAVGSTAMTLMRQTRGRSTWHELWVVECGRAAVQVGRYSAYPDALAGIGQWGEYLHSGGSIAAWRRPQRVTATARRVPARTAIAAKAR
jgi:hypothetical protein